MPYPLRANEAERLRHLRELRIVGTTSSIVLDQICTFARELLAVPMVAITLLDEDSQWLHSSSGLTSDRMPREIAFCNYTILGEEVVVVPDAQDDPRFATNPLVTGGVGLRFYAGVPLPLEPGIPVATLCCLDTKPRRFSARHRKVLNDLGAIALTQLKLHRANLALDDATKTDELTGLPNRMAFREGLEGAMEAATSEGHRAAVLFIDLDSFKEVNDTRWHDAGDALLKDVAQKIRTCLPVSALAARIGGDEFSVLLPSISASIEAERIAEDLLEALRMPIRVEGGDASCRASIGISVFPDDASDAKRLLKGADIALYAAKQSGRDRLAVFRPEMQNRILMRVNKLSRAREALRDGQIVPFYQPKIALSTGRVVGFEALLRLERPDGIRPPSDIDAAFSDPSLTVELSRVMLEQVIQDMATWSANGIAFGSVALNATEWDLTKELPCRILQHLSNAGLRPGALQVEVTESVFLGQSTGSIKAVIQDLRSAGIQVSLDDFGTGFASLTHLRDFRVDWLKLDRSFIGKIDSEHEAAAIVHGVISLAQSLGLGIVAEGIETGPQLEFLKRRHCDLGQGYLFSKAIAAAQVPDLIQSWRGVHQPAIPTSKKTLRSADQGQAIILQ